jgi:hypothetical protein
MWLRMAARRQLEPAWAFLLIVLITTTVSCVSGHVQDRSLSFIFLPFIGGNSPSMDLMGVAAALQARSGSVVTLQLMLHS